MLDVYENMITIHGPMNVTLTDYVTTVMLEEGGAEQHGRC